MSLEFKLDNYVYFSRHTLVIVCTCKIAFAVTIYYRGAFFVATERFKVTSHLHVTV
jgi:hypothetical protein